MSHFSFNPAGWLEALDELPAAAENEPPQPVFSSYLREHVFDVLRRGEAVDLSSLNWEEITLENTTTEMSKSTYRKTRNGWIGSLQHHLTKASPAVRLERRFF